MAAGRRNRRGQVRRFWSRARPLSLRKGGLAQLFSADAAPEAEACRRSRLPPVCGCSLGRCMTSCCCRNKELTMVIAVTTKNPSVKLPVQFEMQDRSGAHIELTAAIHNLPPVSHAFAFNEGEVITQIDGITKPGTYKCIFIVQAFKHKALNRMYDVALTVNGKPAAAAIGTIPSSRTNDVGFGDFTLTVV
jgi:hypothetical protein